MKDQSIQRKISEIISADMVYYVTKEGNQPYEFFCPTTIDASAAKEQYSQADSISVVKPCDVPAEVMKLLKQQEEYPALEARLKKGAKFLCVKDSETISYEIAVYKQGEYYE